MGPCKFFVFDRFQCIGDGSFLMSVLISALLICLFGFAIYRFYLATKDKVKFFAQGFDYGFHRKDISVLWKLAKECGIEEPMDLYVSENGWKRKFLSRADVPGQALQVQDKGSP